MNSYGRWTSSPHLLVLLPVAATHPQYPLDGPLAIAFPVDACLHALRGTTLPVLRQHHPTASTTTPYYGLAIYA